jgi:CheY-like chemotaxis protein
MPKHIAVFNHSDNLLRLFQVMLTPLGYKVSTYKQDMLSLKDIELLRPDVIILGYFKGYPNRETTVIRTLRADPKLSHIPIIVCTTGSWAVERQLEQEPIPYVQLIKKPFDLRTLANAVEAALAQPNN